MWVRKNILVIPSTLHSHKNQAWIGCFKCRQRSIRKRESGSRSTSARWKCRKRTWPEEKAENRCSRTTKWTRIWRRAYRSCCRISDQFRCQYIPKKYLIMEFRRERFQRGKFKWYISLVCHWNRKTSNNRRIWIPSPIRRQFSTLSESKGMGSFARLGFKRDSILRIIRYTNCTGGVQWFYNLVSTWSMSEVWPKYGY